MGIDCAGPGAAVAAGAAAAGPGTRARQVSQWSYWPQSCIIESPAPPASVGPPRRRPGRRTRLSALVVTVTDPLNLAPAGSESGVTSPGCSGASNEPRSLHLITVRLAPGLHLQNRLAASPTVAETTEAHHQQIDP